MTTFNLIYNPFTKEKRFCVNGVEDNFEECWGTDNKELSEWSSNFFERLYRKYNDSEMTIKFKGILRDYEFLEDAKEQYEAENKSVKISLLDNGCSDITEKLGKLKKLFEKMQAETPFEQLKTEEVKQLFEKAISSDFEMAVVATVSSGKSTLINSMLGRELLPARNEATTATIAKIHDIDGADHFKGTNYDKDHNALSPTCDPLLLSNMNELNDNPDTSIIEIYGDIEGIESKDLQLILIDTPGPNNSRTNAHKEHTYSLLKADYKPMILYVLDAGHLAVGDDAELLKVAAKEMNSGGRQAQERFIFVLNKADQFDPAKGEDVPKKIEDIKNYLEEHNIHNPRIFPAAAQMAKVIRQYQNKQPLTETEEDDILPRYKKIIERKWKHFSDFSPLSSSAKKKQEEMLASAQGNNDAYTEALIYTGIPAIELAISEYLTKYALPTKITEGVYSFKEKIDNLGVEATEKEKLKGNQAEVEKLSKALKEIESVLKNGHKAEAVCAKVDSLSIQNQLKEDFEKLNSVLMGELVKQTQKMKSDRMTREQANENIQYLNTFLPELISKFRVDINNNIESGLTTLAQNAVDEYKKYITDLIGSISYEIESAAVLGDTATISLASTLNAYAYSREEKVGTHLEKEAGFWGGVKRVFTFGHAGYVTIADYEKKEYIDFSEFIRTEITPKFIEATKSIEDLAFNYALEEENKFKDFFKNQLNMLNEAIKKKVSEQKQNLENKESFERMIEENKRNLTWLNNFKKDLDSLLAI